MAETPPPLATEEAAEKPKVIVLKDGEVGRDRIVAEAARLFPGPVRRVFMLMGQDGMPVLGSTHVFGSVEFALDPSDNAVSIRLTTPENPQALHSFRAGPSDTLTLFDGPDRQRLTVEYHGNGEVGEKPYLEYVEPYVGPVAFNSKGGLAA